VSWESKETLQAAELSQNTKQHIYSVIFADDVQSGDLPRYFDRPKGAYSISRVLLQGKLTKTAMSVECLIYSRKSIDIEDFERRREVLKVKRRSERKYSENRSEDFWHRREKSSSFPPSLSRPLKQASNPSVNSKLFRLNQLQQRNVQPTANDKTDTSFQRNRLWIGSSWKDEISAVGQDGERVLRLTRRSVRR